MKLSDVPGLGGYLDRRAQLEHEETSDLQQAGSLAQLQALLENRQRDAQLRGTLAQSGGNLQKAMEASIAGGNLQGAGKLAALLEVQRKATAPRVVAPGSQLLGPNNEVLHSVPHRPEAQPEFVRLTQQYGNLQAMLQGLPEEHALRPQVQSAAEQLKARIDHLTGSDRANKPFGAGTTGGALDLMTRHAKGYAEGTLTPELDRAVEAAVTHYTQPRQFQDPERGLMTIRNELPAFMQDAVRRRRGATPGAQPSPGAAPAPRPQPAPGGGPQPVPPPAAGGGAPRPFAGKTVWDLAPDLAGPIPAASEFAGRTPLVGDMMISPEMTQARNYVTQMNRDLVRSLQNNSRYSEGERRAIEKEISIDPKIFDNPTAYRNRLIAIYDGLTVRLRNETETANSQDVGRDERIRAKNNANKIRQYLPSLGIPPRINTDAEWEALESGTEYIAPNGHVKRKR